MENMRLWSKSQRREDSRWTLRENDAAGLAWARKLLAEYRDAEPGAGWTLETRGTVADWHRFYE